MKVLLKFKNSRYNVSSIVFTYVFSMLSLGRIVISDLVVADLFMNSLSGIILLYLAASFLNQMCAGHRPACTWFLIIVSANVCMCMCLRVCVCVSTPRLLITSGMMWCDIDPYDWLNKFYGFYMAAVVDIVSGRDVSIHTRREN